MNRVLITGIGALCPLGNVFESSWKALKDETSGIATITRFDASEIRYKISGELKKFDPNFYLSNKEKNRLDLFAQYAVFAALMAVNDADMSNNNQLSSAGVIIGSSRGAISTIEKSFKSNSKNSEYMNLPLLMPSTTVSSAASYAAQRLGIKGYCLGVSNACASGANAIGEAYRLIKHGYADMIIAGGSEAPLCEFCFKGYGRLSVLSKVNEPSASRPFDKDRDGFVLSEGACLLVLENYEKAKSRKARIYGEIIGYGNTTDAYHQTRPDSDGEAKAIKLALDEAGISPNDLDYINAHAASTQLGDKAEAKAVKSVFGKHSDHVPVSAVKSMTGHMLSASGAFEAAVTVMSLKEGVITPTINFKNIDPDCHLNHVTKTIKSDIKTAISNSFGFGGVNVVLVFKKI